MMMVERSAVPERVQILVVDDDSTWRRLFPAVIKSNKADAILAPSAEKGVGIIKSGVPLAGVVTDGLDGKWKQVVDAAMERGIPVLVISGESDIINAVKARGLSAVGKGEESWPSVLKEFLEAVRKGS